MAKLIIGCGYLGLRVARRWLDEGETVHALTRSADRAIEFEQLGIAPIIGDVTVSESLARLPICETLLYAIGYDAAAGRSRQQVQINGIKSVLDVLPAETGRIVFISTTGVYGQTTGEWLDEESVCGPTREAGLAALSAERHITDSRFGERTIILRLAGIYGPGRIPHRRDIIAARPIAASPDSYLNLIHVEDAVEAVLAAAKRTEPPRLYLVSDGSPVRRGEFLAELARLVDAPAPRFEVPAPQALAASRSGTDKRISNARLRRELSFTPRYPSYREGLAAIVCDTME